MTRANKRNTTSPSMRSQNIDHARFVRNLKRACQRLLLTQREHHNAMFVHTFLLPKPHQLPSFQGTFCPCGINLRLLAGILSHIRSLVCQTVCHIEAIDDLTVATTTFLCPATSHIHGSLS